MKNIHDLSGLEWHLSGYAPFAWRSAAVFDAGSDKNVEVTPIDVAVPGSVQRALLEAGIIPDWNMGLNARLCEWAENRDWAFGTRLPDDWFKPGVTYRLRCDGLDGPGLVIVNGKEAGTFSNSFMPLVFDLTPHLHASNNSLTIVFQPPPRWLGQSSYTSRITEWKPRFNYSWDWTSRLVQIGIYDSIAIEAVEGPCIEDSRLTTSAEVGVTPGILSFHASISSGENCKVVVTLENEFGLVKKEEVPAEQFAAKGIAWKRLPVYLWWPNGMGEQPLYTFTCALVDSSGNVADKIVRKVGFRQIEWKPCEGAPANADPWLCVVNGKPVFLQGVNWTPIRPNFADVPDAEVCKRLEVYKKLGVNVFRVWGGATLEKEFFYNHCDELGFLVWQEFPLSSSSLDNWPPEDKKSIEELAVVAESYVSRRRHHPSLLLWCGGNELLGAQDGGKVGSDKPVDCTHPLIKRFAQIVKKHDPGRRFIPTSPSGPWGHGHEERYGQGLHWDVHGPWTVVEDNMEAQRRYWSHDDALFRSEVGAPGASSADIIKGYSGGLPLTPGTVDNPLWRRTSWWIDWPTFVKEKGREPQSLEEYVAWSQERQAEALRIAASACKSRFPRCGGFIIWMGHDSFPCTANTAVLDFEGRPKPAALALAEVFLKR